MGAGNPDRSGDEKARVSWVPKREIVEIILAHAPDGAVRQEFHVKPDTENLAARLESFAKPRLLDYLYSLGEAAVEALRTKEEQYPARGPITLYMVSLHERTDLYQTAAKLQGDAQDAEWTAPPDEIEPPVRVIRIDQVTPRTLLKCGERRVLQINLLYERRIAYWDADSADEYGEPSVVWSVQLSRVWIPEEPLEHGLVLCSYFPAFKRILRFARDTLQLPIWGMNIPPELFDKLAEGGRPRTATFLKAQAAPALRSAAATARHSPLADVTSITLSDPELQRKQAYSELLRDKARHRSATYVLGHRAVPEAGLGFASRWGRIWTPRHVAEDALLVMALELIERTEKTVREMGDGRFAVLIEKERPRPVFLGTKKLAGEARDHFDRLAQLLLKAIHNKSSWARVDPGLFRRLVELASLVGLVAVLEYQCKHCGYLLATCPEHGVPVHVQVREGDWALRCPVAGCSYAVGPPVETITCDCGEEVDVNLPGDVMLFPSASLAEAMHDFLRTLPTSGDTELRERIKTSLGWWCIRGATVYVYPPPTHPPPLLSLGELGRWRHALKRVAGGGGAWPEDDLVQALRHIGEKCQRSVTRQQCEECCNRMPTTEEILEGKVCLPRIFGLPIGQCFDGIHHGHEGADVCYEDTEESTEATRRIAIHLKSWRRRRKLPTDVRTGRADRAVQGLYAQALYSAWRRHRKTFEFDVLGIGMPCQLTDDAKGAFEFLAGRVGVELVFVELGEWLDILRCALQDAEFEHGAEGD